MVKKLFFWTAGIVLALDILTKILVSTFQPSIKVLPFFSITYVENTGALFGMLKSYQLLFIIVSIIVLAAVYYYYKLADKKQAVIGLALIGEGTLGNLIGRISNRFVIDFLDFFIGTHHWPAFNIADSALVIGVALLLIYWRK